MALRGDSYSSTSEVKAVTRRYLDGQSAFNSTTVPTGTELEKFIDRASGILNSALAQRGLSTPITNTTAKLLCDDWVTVRAGKFVEASQPHGYGGEESAPRFENLMKSAQDFANMNTLGFKRLGVPVADPSYQGLTFTGLTAPGDRTDPADSSVAQPLFRRKQFNDPANINST